MKYPQSSYVFNGITVTNTWIKDSKISKYHPVTQVYGVVFNDSGEILIARESSDNKWQIPGGTPESNENPANTLKRELKEEVDVEVKGLIPLGVQKTKMPGNPNKKAGDLFYQVRYIALLDKLLSQTPDPDRGNIWERKFINSSKITEVINWGSAGDAMFKDAISLFKSIKNS